MLEFYLLKTYLALLHWQIITEYAQAKQQPERDAESDAESNASRGDEPSTVWQYFPKG